MKINKNSKDIFIGFLVALLTNTIGIIIFWSVFSENSFEHFLLKMQKLYFLGSIIALTSLPNLLLFFLFLKRNYTQRAKGVLLYSFLVALFTLVLKFI